MIRGKRSMNVADCAIPQLNCRATITSRKVALDTHLNPLGQIRKHRVGNQQRVVLDRLNSCGHRNRSSQGSLLNGREVADTIGIHLLGRRLKGHTGGGG